MALRAFDVALIGLILAGFVFAGIVNLGFLVLTHNPPNLILLTPFLSIMLFGLAFGWFAGRWLTKSQFNSLTVKGEWESKDTKHYRLYFALGFGLVCFSGFIPLLHQSFPNTVPFWIVGFPVYELLFAIPAAFTFFVTRFILIASWQNQKGKVILTDKDSFSGMLYVESI